MSPILATILATILASIIGAILACGLVLLIDRCEAVYYWFQHRRKIREMFARLDRQFPSEDQR